MASLPLSFIISVVLATYCRASSVLTPRENHIVRFPVIHSTNQDVFGDVWAKRGIQTVALANRSDVAYYAKLNIGNPPQPNYVQLDTGSFELWVNPDCNNLSGTSDQRFCQAVGSYDPSKSSSAKQLGTAKTLKYGIGSANIRYVTDDIQFGNEGNKLKSVQFGSALDTQDEFAGIMGIGHGINVTTNYKNFVDELQSQGLTQTKAFSLALGSKDEQEGVVIFGGLDTAKFSGPLVSQPIVPASKSPDGVPRYWVSMDFMSITPPSGKTTIYTNTSMDVFFDSGSTLTLLPPTLANAIAKDFGADATDSNGFYPVDCSLNDLSGTVDFAFPGVTIHVPYSEMIRELQTSFGQVCYLGISPSNDFALLGDTMLRSAYAVFDQTSNAIHLAQYVNCGSNEMEITKTMNMSAITGKCAAPSFKPTGTSASATTSTMTLLPTSTVTATTGSQTSSGKPSSSGPRIVAPIDWLRMCVAVAVALGFTAVFRIF